MRYSHPNKAPQTPMYYWIVRTYEKHRIELENLLELSAIHWYERYKEIEKYFQATPIKLFWESIKEQFPEVYIDTGLLPKTLLEIEENNKQLRSENERIQEAIGLLRNWAEAYPLEFFPEPDLKLARKLLEDGGVNYSALNAYTMRHVINGVKRILDDALGGKNE